MFTGIVEEIGLVDRVITMAMEKKGNGKRLFLKNHRIVHELVLGESIAVNGCCLTVVEINNGIWAVDIVPETLAVTTLDELKPGDVINLERALKMGERLSGHLVQGHVDGTGKLLNMRQNADSSWIISISASKEILRYIVQKGSITVSGVSLTVMEVSDCHFSFAMIPHTAKVTTLGLLKIGDTVNLEVDIIAKYIEKLLASNAN